MRTLVIYSDFATSADPGESVLEAPGRTLEKHDGRGLPEAPGRTPGDSRESLQEARRRPGRRPGGGQEEAREDSREEAREDSREEAREDSREEPGGGQRVVNNRKSEGGGSLVASGRNWSATGPELVRNWSATDFTDLRKVGLLLEFEDLGGGP